MLSYNVLRLSSFIMFCNFSHWNLQAIIYDFRHSVCQVNCSLSTNLWANTRLSKKLKKGDLLSSAFACLHLGKEILQREFLLDFDSINDLTTMISHELSKAIKYHLLQSLVASKIIPIASKIGLAGRKGKWEMKNSMEGTVSLLIYGRVPVAWQQTSIKKQLNLYYS